MKKLIKGVELIINYYKSNSSNYIPIYSGDELIAYGKREVC